MTNEMMLAEFKKAYKEMNQRADDLQEHLDKKFAAVHRNIRSGDKVAKILVALVDKAAEVCSPELWRCEDCGHEDIWEPQQAAEGGTPVCPRCDIDMTPIEPQEHLFETEEWLRAEEHVLRIKRIKAEKEEKKKGKK